ncbi:tannase/feruloyl esterase family alpha/beta hydrolase [Ramlibacter sp. G-1-2-2]|uniref:Tannase/feruloyl esterase family alpha/beta hydrolase n=1 Tax=Ramlibacter agri TaxID=2728837 RepID=A0A848HAX7_9BURK|nr:tannase/feruloyl esterase family alpha/beta hydrolase [Ramlibacter agri]NML47634.1 tannase/feruloyl esterase family alpha/beta hydrolase [Ramlibacter agri]
MTSLRGPAAPALAALLLLAGCASVAPAPHPAQPGVATASCEALAQQFSWPGLHILSTQRVAAGTLKLPGIAEAMPEHCVVTARLNERKGPVDGKDYAIGFEMRLPTQWNGRFFYQANGGLDGFVTPAYGNILGGGPRTNGLQKGFAVLSSDAGHAFERSNPVIGAATFGVDPQARLDYGYNAVAQLTPMARGLIAHYYGRPADRAYLVGSSNGGRHGMVAAARDTGGYDGIAVTTPGYNLPLAAVTQAWDAQQFATVARAKKGSVPDLETSFTPAESQVLSDAILQRCDALDGARDGLVGDLAACQRAFDPQRDIASCAGDSGEHCLSPARKQVLAKVFAGPGLYAGMPWDPGVRGRNWREWKFVNSIGPRDAIALAFVFVTPPSSPQVVSGAGSTVPDFALNFSLERDAPKVYAKDATYTQSAMEFMTPPAPTSMNSFVARGGKILVAHGAADPVFSVLDSIKWYEGFVREHGAAQDSARLFVVPGMNHSNSGPAADQFDLVDAVVAWVEQGVTPQQVVASVRGPGSNAPNPEVPAGWSANRTRLLCPWPQVARYRGTGDAESAASFQCAP